MNLRSAPPATKPTLSLPIARLPANEVMFSEAIMLHLTLGIDFCKNEVRLEATERSKPRDSSYHTT